MSRSGQWFWALVAAQAVFLLGWAGYHEVVRRHAPVLLLKGRPVDPQDLLRGDYMILSYDISNVPLPSSTTPTGRNGPDLWVLLEQQDRHHVAVQAAYEKLTPKPGQVLVRGSIHHGRPTPADTGRVDYGIEKYFVPEGKGTPRFKLMEVEVSVSPVHRLYIRQVLLDGQAFP